LPVFSEIKLFPSRTEVPRWPNPPNDTWRPSCEASRQWKSRLHCSWLVHLNFNGHLPNIFAFLSIF
jgi:hypothetical protein